MKLAAALAIFATVSAFAGQTPEQIEFFEKRIRPVLAQECYECHNSNGKKKGGLILDFREGLKAGGKTGAAIVPGNAADSLLIKTIRHAEEDLQMPKNGAKLEERIIRDFETWVNMGAPDPRDKPPTKEELTRDTAWPAVLQRRKNWWAFQPVQNPPLPAVNDAAWSQNPLDRFVLSKLETENLKPAADADAGIFLRRLSYILIGLPPPPEEVDAFAASYRLNPDLAIERAVDRLLASPRFGETWARHWMDWMRYAETHGSEGDPAIPYAWRYRDYLIRALNADVPYADLVREHIAGDLLKNPRVDKNLGINESAIGPAHFRMVLHGFSPTDSLDEQVTFTDNQIDTVSKAFLGVTVSCARCHDHKFDAISQADFYAFYGIMASGRPATIDVNLPERQFTHVEKLSQLKTKIRDEASTAWLKDIDGTLSRLADLKSDKNSSGAFAAWVRLAPLSPEKWKDEWAKLGKEWKDYSGRLAAFRTQDAQFNWDFRTQENGAAKDGVGVRQGVTPAGEFHVFHDGDRVISNIYPAGVYSHGLSTKHRGILSSPNFKADGGKLWVRARGGSARVRYVVCNYPRSGTVHQKHDLNTETDHWTNWNLDYWTGDSLHFEISTGEDQPVETTKSERSWFGLGEVLYAENLKGPPPPAPTISLLALVDENAAPPQSLDELKALYAATMRRCIDAWRAGRMSDLEAEFLAAFVQKDLLPNKLANLPSLAPLIKEYRRLESEIPVPTRAPGLMEGFAFDQPLYHRGDHKQPRDLVPRRFLDAIDNRPFNCGNKASGRQNLADSIAAPSNPLTYRVIVNRLWFYAFGRGLVNTPDNFGRLGDMPTHPELLDYLATRFQKDGTSLKSMLRLMLTSRAFRLDHHASADATARDPENKWFSHFSARRLNAEAIRDSLITRAGNMDFTTGGESVAGSGNNRRSVYQRVIRNNLDPFLAAFDFPVPSATRGKRDATNVPAQSLALMNSAQVAGRANEWVRKVLEKAGKTDEQRVRQMFLEAFSRAPSDKELRDSLAFIASLSGAVKTVRDALQEAERSVAEIRSAIAQEKQQPKDAKSDRETKLNGDLAKAEAQVLAIQEQLKAVSGPDYGWRCFAQALFNAKEFIYVR